MKCFEQARAAPIEHMIIRQRAAVDAGCENDAGVGRAHFIVDALRLGGATICNRGFEIDYSRVRLPALQLIERGTPNVFE